MIHNEKMVCIVEDNADLREVMCMMVSASQEYILGGSYADSEDALLGIPALEPDAVLMDINLPSQSGIICVAKLKAILPQTLFLMCTAYDDDEKVFNSLRAGASGYILKSEGPEGIMIALNDMLNGGSPMSNNIARKVMDSFKAMADGNVLVQSLTTKEKEVLDFLSKGMLNKEVANSMQISLATIRTHIQNIYKKLHVNTRVEAVNLFLKR